MSRLIARISRSSSLSAFAILAAGLLPGLILGLLILLSGCESRSAGTSTSRESGREQAPAKEVPVLPKATGFADPTIPQEPSPFRFAEIAKDAGIDFVHVSGMTEERHFPTANGSGVAIFDYDNDGWMDLYFASNTFLPLGSKKIGENRLYRNLGNGKFEDTTKAAGLDFQGFCHGLVVGDIDNDGDQDIFLATYFQNTLYLNNGDGTFRDIGREAGVAPPTFQGRIVHDANASGTDPVIVDAVEGLRWRVNGGEPSDDLTIKVKTGQKLIFRQADSTAARGLLLLADPGRLASIGQTDKNEAVLREVGAKTSRLETTFPSIAAGAEPVVMAELEVVRDLGEPIPFLCSEHRPAWSSGGAFLDYDNDGDLDLYVSNYGWWTLEQHGSKFCGNVEKKVRQYCSPKEVQTVKHILYRNDGLRNGVPHFTDVTDEAGVGRSDGHGFGVVATDLNDDGLIDLYVANDQNPAFTFLNKGDGTFEDATETSCAAYDEKGATQSGMGADAADVDGDGLPELFKTNFANEYNTLYQNLGHATFYDQTASYGLAADAMQWVGWGCALADFDNDGWPDAFVTNGHVDNNYKDLGIDDVPYEEPALLHRNVPLGEGPGASRRFRLATLAAGPYFEQGHVGRGAAFGDLDNDGDIDIVVNHKDGAPALLRNDTPTENRWVRFDLRGTRSNRDAVGTRIEVVTGVRTIDRQRKGGCSLESANDPRVLIGVGPVDRLETVLVHWPSGAETILKDLETNKTYELVEPDAASKPANDAPDSEKDS